MRWSPIWRGGAYWFFLGCFLEFIPRWFKIPEYIFPLPSRVLQYVGQHGKLFWHHGWVTFCEAFLGVILAWAVALLLGSVGLYFRFFDYILSPFLFILQVIPVVVVGPFIVLLFGFGFFAKVWVVLIFALYPILLSFKEGMKSIDSQFLDVAKLLCAPKFLIFCHVFFPACFLRTLLGVKIALTYSVTSAIVAELLGSSVGLGVLLNRTLSDFNSLALFGDIYIIVIMSALLFFGISLFESRARKKLGIS